MATPYRPGKIFEPPFRLNMTNLSQIFLQNNLALYILSNKNFFLPSLVTYRAVRDLISETKKFANSEDLRFANSEDFTFLMPCCIGCSEINKINRHLICSLLNETPNIVLLWCALCNTQYQAKPRSSLKILLSGLVGQKGSLLKNL